ncbi:MAG: UDP-3-O-(3-hydroxymyristoyl)glucosamine N-acyltransferase [Prevotellaceae bacterium]|nr:UDP-3-O-(3-hydroxymyristoyl)glucosamine N-acyltransferase [Prevotellaceae bacterium]
MEFTAKQIAEFIQGRVEGDENAAINSFAKIEEGREGAISFLSNSKYTHYIYNTKSTVCLVDESLTLEGKLPETLTLIRVKSAYEAVSKLLTLYDSMMPKKTGVHPLAFVSESAKVGENCYIGPFACIGEGVVIGDNCRINPNVVIYDGCKLGNNVVLHSGCVIGADGFGFAPTEHGYDKIPQIGIVVIEDNVEIGANTCIDRSTMGATIIRKGVKLDNLIQIAHNVEVGENTVMASQVGVSGSTKIGQWCMFGGQSGISGHIKIGNQVQIGPQCGVISTIKDQQKVMGSPQIDAKEYFRSYAMFHKLPELYKEIEELKKQIEELKK